MGSCGSQLQVDLLPRKAPVAHESHSEQLRSFQNSLHLYLTCPLNMFDRPFSRLLAHFARRLAPPPILGSLPASFLTAPCFCAASVAHYCVARLLLIGPAPHSGTSTLKERLGLQGPRIDLCTGCDQTPASGNSAVGHVQRRAMPLILTPIQPRLHPFWNMVKDLFLTSWWLLLLLLRSFWSTRGTLTWLIEQKCGM